MAPRGGRQDADAASAPDQQAGGRLAAAVARSGGAASASVRCRAVALAHALDVVGPVRVSSDRLVLPAEYLRAALQQCMLLQLNEMVVTAEVGAAVQVSEVMAVPAIASACVCDMFVWLRVSAAVLAGAAGAFSAGAPPDRHAVGGC